MKKDNIEEFNENIIKIVAYKIYCYRIYRNIEGDKYSDWFDAIKECKEKGYI